MSGVPAAVTVWRVWLAPIVCLSGLCREWLAVDERIATAMAMGMAGRRPELGR